MRDSYSLSEAKAQLSAIIRQVRDGHHVVVTLHGKPAAEIRPIESKPQSIEERFAQMEPRRNSSQSNSASAAVPENRR